MRIIARAMGVLRSWFRPGALDGQVLEELHFHLERQTAANIEAGMAPEEARRAASLTLGSVEAIRDESLAAQPGALVHQTLRDFAFGTRLLRRAPGMAVISSLVVAIGVGATTAIFSAVYAVMLRPLPYYEPDQLVALSSRVPRSTGRVGVHPADHRDLRSSATVFEDIALANAPQNFNLIGSGEPERLVAARLSSNLLPLLGVTPALGRGFTAAEERVGQDRVVLLGDGLWRRRFGADPSIVGRTINLSGDPYEVVGVMRPDFRFPEREHQLWIPLTINPRQLTREVSGYDHLAVARLKPGIDVARAQRETSLIAARLEQQFPKTNRGVRVEVLPLGEAATQQVRPALYVLLAAVACLLLIACLNLALLFGTRAAGRATEFGIRRALGASRGRLALQALAEIAPVLVIGGLAGIAAARLALVALPELPRIGTVEISTPVLGFSVALLIITGLVAGVLPLMSTWRAAVPAANDTRTSTATRDHLRTRNVLVVAQLALTLPLLAGATALIRSFAALMDVDPGFRTENVLTMHMAIPRSKYRSDEQIAAFYTQIVDRVAALPGVVSAGMVNRLPLSGNNQVLRFAFDGVEGEPMTLQSRSVTPGYFRTMGIAVREGRLFADRDTARAPLVGIVDEHVARTLWPGQSAVGRRFRVALPGQKPQSGEIVGVVGGVHHGGLQTDQDRHVYLNYQQFTDGRIVLVARTAVDVRAAVSAIAGAIRSLDPEQPVYDVRTMDDVLTRATTPWRLSMTVVSAFALSSLLLASVGLYGLVAHGVAQRRREFAVRLALGAPGLQVLQLVVRKGAVLAVCGAILGLGGAVAMLLAMRRLLYGVTPLDPLGLATAAALLVGVALAASYLPARRASLTNPASTLRAE